MQNVFRKYYTVLSLLLFIYPVSGCRFNADRLTSAYDNHPFDSGVIKRLPVYDSLAAAVLEKYPLLLKNFNANESYNAFRYMPASSSTEVFNKLPPEAGDDIDKYFAKIGKNFIYGFDVFKDSTIKIYIRRYLSDSTAEDIEENLSYYPAGNKIRQREFPDKDTILGKYWQYWIRFNKRGLF